MSGVVEQELLLVGTSPVSQALLEDIHSAARTHAKVLILGETGVGKELVARLIHARSARRLQPFVALNCSGIPETLLESELFGHMRGSFTGAYRDKPGLARMADRGTLFLDELGEMSLRMQAVLLRFAETGEVQPIGADRTVARTDVRLVAATHRDLPALVASQAFRDDLYYRLNVIQIRVPPLRERRGDIPALLAHFLERSQRAHGAAAPSLHPSAERCLQEYAWPGNIRELKNVVERLVVRDVGRSIHVDDLPEEIRGTWRPARAAGLGVAVDPSDPSAPRAGNVPELLWAQMQAGESFWAAVAEPFKNHDLTRADVRAVVQRGLEEIQGGYRGLLDAFNLPADDYKRLLSFLRQHKCQLPLTRVRAIAASRPAAGEAPGRTQVAS